MYKLLDQRDTFDLKITIMSYLVIVRHSATMLYDNYAMQMSL